MRRTLRQAGILVLAVPLFLAAQARQGWPKPAIIVAPAYPAAALAVGIEATVKVTVDIDQHGQVTRAMASNGPCSYSSPAALQADLACDFARQAEAHRALSEELRSESLDESQPQPQRRQKFKEAYTEYWLAAQAQIYAAAESAARQWLFESSRPASPPGHHTLNVTFRFAISSSPSIQVVDAWSVTVEAARYPGVDD
jgi:hypothetical protein